MAFVSVGLVLPSWLGLRFWLESTVSGWPEAYGSACIRKCEFQHLAISPGLLEEGWRELALFVALWFWPASLALMLLVLFVAKRGIFANSQAE
jgi:thiosulfate reductase cytochrome b subunit